MGLKHGSLNEENYDELMNHQILGAQKLQTTQYSNLAHSGAVRDQIWPSTWTFFRWQVSWKNMTEPWIACIEMWDESQAGKLQGKPMWSHSQLTGICQFMPAMIRVTTVMILFCWAKLRYPARNSLYIVGRDSYSFTRMVDPGSKIDATKIPGFLGCPGRAEVIFTWDFGPYLEGEVMHWKWWI